MRVELEPPSWYQPLPSVASETTHRFRWPVLQTRQIGSPPPNRLSVEGPLQSPPPKPRLRYHKQSTYSDVFNKLPLSNVTTPIIESLWRYPVGKYGDFSEETTYEREYRWPSKVEHQLECMPPPLVSTMGLGIIPILGRGDGPQVAEKPSEERVVRKELAENFVAAQRQENPSYWVRNCKPSRPTEQIWQGQTSHRTDYVLHPVDRNVSQKVLHKSTLKFAGKMETMSSAMIDYPDPYRDSNEASSSCECSPPDNDQSASDKSFDDIHITITVCPIK